MALDFPASPNINDTYTSGGVTWTWDGTTWKVLGRFQFTSSETDPIFSASPASNILSSHITNWDTSYGWGDHSAAGYLTTTGSISSHTDVSITTLQDAQLLKYSVANAAWENWTPNFLTSYTETDPVFAASPAGGITGTNITNWNTAYNWGDHSTGGYLTAESDTLATVTGRGATTTTDITTTGKVFYSNNFADLTALNAVNTGTYHGMFAHVHATGKGYFSHNNVTSIAVTVGVDSVAGQSTGVFYFNGVEKPGSFIIRRGVTYTFDQSDSSNATYGSVHHPLMISTTLDGELNGGSHYMTGVTYKLDGVVRTMAEYVSGFVAATTRTVEWTPVSNAPDILYYWCHFHTGQGNSFSIGSGTWVELLDTNSSLANLHGVDLSIPPANGEVLKFDGANWVAAADGGGGAQSGANVTISDTIPAGTPSAGDLWWESDTGRLKVYYTDTDSSQWVDASPPLADATTIGASGTVSMKAHILPDTNAAWDIGSAEYKIRHLFLSDNTLYHEGPFIKTAQHDAGGSAQTTSYVITLAKLKEALNASANYEAFKTAILAITDA